MPKLARILRRTLAGRDGETCSRDLRQSPQFGDEIPPVAFVATLRPGPGDDVGANGSSLGVGDGGLLLGV